MKISNFFLANCFILDILAKGILTKQTCHFHTLRVGLFIQFLHAPFFEFFMRSGVVFHHYHIYVLKGWRISTAGIFHVQVNQSFLREKKKELIKPAFASSCLKTDCLFNTIWPMAITSWSTHFILLLSFGDISIISFLGDCRNERNHLFDDNTLWSISFEKVLFDYLIYTSQKSRQGKNVWLNIF